MSVYSWDEVGKYQNDVARIIKNSYRLNRISHAYIFEGPNGTKKTSTAFLYAKSLLCTNSDAFNPCNECHNCRRVENRTHPNLFYVKPKGKVIKKEQIKDLIREFSKASIEKGPRIYIIEEAEKLNLTSANTLLKTMEEPGQDIYQILITENYNSLLKTIISRAEILHFKPIDRNLIKEHLVKQGIAANIANSISEYTVDMGSAIKFAEDFKMINIIKLVTEIHNSFLVKNLSPILLFKESSQDVFQDQEITDFFLMLMIFYQKDILNYQLRHLDSICFEEEIETIKKLADKIAQKHIEQNITNMLGLKARLKYNINNKLAFDKMLACLERGYKYATYCSGNTV
ncbi:MAG: AAA family ATPase [Tenericutes bacterium]|nr:AAA family ATPase [Mycoplasmatota bacterium]